MFKRRFRLPSPALVVSMIALSLVLGGTAVAAATAKHKDAKADTKLVKKLAPSLSVKHAKTADSATNATNATSATNATNATTAANANALGGVAASSYVQNAGNIFVQLGHANWQSFNSTDPVKVTRFTNLQGLTATTTGDFDFRIDGTAPSSLYGKGLAVSGVQICYDATAGPTITNVFLESDLETTTGFGTTTTLAHDSTARSDAACRTYSPAAPAPLTSQTQISIFLTANWTTANTELVLGRATLILQPTSTAATSPKRTPSGTEAPGAKSH